MPAEAGGGACHRHAVDLVDNMMSCFAWVLAGGAATLPAWMMTPCVVWSSAARSDYDELRAISVQEEARR